MKSLYILAVLLAFICGIFAGNKLKETEIKQKAYELPDDIDCYNNQDIEYVLFDGKKPNYTNR